MYYYTSISFREYCLAFLAALGLASVILLGAPSVLNAQSNCAVYGSGSAALQGFGVPYDVGSKALLLKVSCTGSGATVTIGTGADTEYIYEKGHEWRNNAWQPFMFTGAKKNGLWLVGTANKTLSRSESELSQANYVLAYVCIYRNSAWKCGCRDSACATPYWQLQAFKSTQQPTQQATQQSTQQAGGNIKLTTDKSTYYYGDTIKVTIANQGTQSIQYHSGPGCGATFAALMGASGAISQTATEWLGFDLDPVRKMSGKPCVTQTIAPGGSYTDLYAVTAPSIREIVSISVRVAYQGAYSSEFFVKGSGGSGSE